MNRSLFLIPLFMFLLIEPVLPHAEAHSGVSLSGYGTPTLDGSIGAAEWSFAGTFTDRFANYSVTIYMMNDAVNLYMAVSISAVSGYTAWIDDDLTWNDGFDVCFDNHHRGGTHMELGDDGLRVYWGRLDDLYYDYAYYDYYFTGEGTMWSDCYPPFLRSFPPGTNDGQVAQSSQGVSIQFEVSHPLDSGDHDHDFSLSPGQTVGFGLVVIVNYAIWRSNSHKFEPWFYPLTFADYVVASGLGNAVYVTAESPVNLLVIAPNGLRVGYDPLTGGVVEEIPGAFYSGSGSEPQVIVIPNRVPGNYIVDAYGIGIGSYTITIKSLAYDGSVISAQSVTGTAVSGRHYTYTCQMGGDGSLTPLVADITPPTTALTIGAPSWMSSDLSSTYVTSGTAFTLKAQDELGGSGVYKTFCRIDEGDWVEYLAPFTLSGYPNGAHTIYYQSMDLARNLEEIKSAAVNLITPIRATEWTYHEDVEGLTALSFTSSFIITDAMTEIIVIEIHNDGPADITLTRVSVTRATPSGAGSAPCEVLSALPSIASGQDGSFLTEISITELWKGQATAHLWVYFTINGVEYHVGVNVHYRTLLTRR